MNQRKKKQNEETEEGTEAEANMEAEEDAVVEEEIEVDEDVDVVVDGPFVLSQRDLMLDFRGSRNQRLIDIPKYLNNESDFIVKR